MPPRRNPRRSAHTLPTSDNLQASPLAISPCTEVWNIVELRTRILEHITDRKDLASLMRVEKLGMALIAEKLWHTVSHERVRSTASMPAARRELYRGAITVLKAQDLILTPAMIQQLQLDIRPRRRPPPPPMYTSMPQPDGAESESSLDSEDDWAPSAAQLREEHNRRASAWLGSYHAELYPVLLSTLLKQCSGLKTIVFGAEYQPFAAVTSWVVHLDRYDEQQRPSGPARSPIERGIGRIQHVQTFRFSRGGTGSITQVIDANTPISPHDAITMESRFDLQLDNVAYGWSHLATTQDRWVRAFENEAIFSNLYRAVDFGGLSISLDIITGLFQRQIDADHADRLQVIIATKIHPFTLDDLQAFAKVASSSLTRLVIATSRPATRAGAAIIGREKLPDLIDIVRHSLPNLEDIEFRMENMDEAEELYRQGLVVDTLRARGSVTNLCIHTRTLGAPLNLLRRLSVMLAEGASVKILQTYGIGRGGIMDLSQCLNCLRTHSNYLATLDLSFLGVTTPTDLVNLTYDATGHPIHLLVAESGKWLHDVATLDEPMPAQMIIDLKAARRKLDQATRQLVGLSNGMLADSGLSAAAKQAAVTQLVELKEVQRSAMRKIRKTAGMSEPIIALARKITRALGA